ncbi:hypothetical protein N3K66_004146 [Trichothecium roseum]|uniref:Uncharacterized protein n=1 Tax=Trichothecium roseum TaxID=47278 RepID=A0ACC0V1W8_9HYPO|nr:hypothetical protein N3K66_004146 [Trichothecium roseum]
MSGLKSTYKPAAPTPQAALPPGWTEHTAPTGHAYYYNAETNESTYQRPISQSFIPQRQPGAPNLSDPRVANAYLAQLNQSQSHAQRGGFHGGRGGRGGSESRPKPQPKDKPVRREAIPGHEPWVLVYTKYSRRFAYNTEKNTSFWRIPEKLMPGILELDKARIRQKVGGDAEASKEEEEGEKAEEEKGASKDTEIEELEKNYDSSEYEEVEVEVTDDEDGDEHQSKRQRTAQPEEDENPVEFTEADIAAQLQAMGEDYGLEPGDYDDGHMEDWAEGAEGVEFSEEDAKLLFRDMLEDYGINPYSPWEKLLEEGKVIEDPRYTALSTTKSRRECWDEWSREKIAAVKEARAKQEKKDPRVAYMAFLQEKASPKLYWPEFRRKYKKEAVMKDLHFSDKDREKAYRDYIARLKLPLATRKSDLTSLLKAQPTHVLNNRSTSTALPTQVLVDVRYIALEPTVRDPLIEAFVQTLPPPPDDVNDAAAEEEARQRRARREKALEERDRTVDEARRQREVEERRAKARLREGEREVEVAMRVGKGGLRSQLVDSKDEAS